jgi:hypothetical protein
MNTCYLGLSRSGMGNTNPYCVLVYGPGALDLGIPDRISTYSSLNMARGAYDSYVNYGGVKKVSILV